MLQKRSSVLDVLFYVDAFNGSQQSRAQARESQQLLTIPEEDVLVAWCRQLTVTGYPARHNVLREMAEEIRARRLKGVNTKDEILVTYPPIGQCLLVFLVTLCLFPLLLFACFTCLLTSESFIALDQKHAFFFLLLPNSFL